MEVLNFNRKHDPNVPVSIEPCEEPASLKQDSSVPGQATCRDQGKHEWYLKNKRTKEAEADLKKIFGRRATKLFGRGSIRTSSKSVV